MAGVPDLLYLILPYEVADFLQTQLRSPTVQSLSHNLYSLVSRTASVMGLLVAPLQERVLEALTKSPDVVVFAFAVAVFFAAACVIRWLQRLAMLWIRLVVRAVFWTALVALLSVAYGRGAEQTFNDAVAVGCKIVGYAVGIGNVFMDQWTKYSEQEERARAASGYPFPSQGRTEWR